MGTVCGLPDAQLLERFVTRHDETAEAAFETLVLRHGSMVFDISLKILDNTHDAQDAFQATFLILATRARSIMCGAGLSRVGVTGSRCGSRVEPDPMPPDARPTKGEFRW